MIARRNVCGAVDKCVQNMLTIVALSVGTGMLVASWFTERLFPDDSH